MKGDIKWAAEQCLEHGKKVRRCGWGSTEYIYFDKEKCLLMDEDGTSLINTLKDFLILTSCYVNKCKNYNHIDKFLSTVWIDGEWELFEDTRKDIISELKDNFYKLDSISMKDIFSISAYMNHMRALLKKL